MNKQYLSASQAGPAEPRAETQTTPYDTEIAELLAKPHDSWTSSLRIVLEHQRQGYLRAKAEDAELLAVAQAVLTLSASPYAIGSEWDLGGVQAQARAAIEKAERRAT